MGFYHAHLEKIFGGILLRARGQSLITAGRWLVALTM